MKFTKMHGLGNDYVYVNCFLETVENPEETARAVSDRHTGIGSDGLILICPSETADFQMVIYNADGSRAQMCGNGIRCVGKYVYDRGLTDKTEITVETLGGVRTLQLHTEGGRVSAVTVDMGQPVLQPDRIPVLAGGSAAVNLPLEAGGRSWEVTCLSMGNPHAVVFVPDPAALPLETLGPQFEHHPLFPERINTEFVRVDGPDELTMRVWERGAGETQACGTGACAAAAAAVLTGNCKPAVTVHLPGGDLKIRWDRQNNHIFMTGPATFVFDGETNI